MRWIVVQLPNCREAFFGKIAGGKVVAKLRRNIANELGGSYLCRALVAAENAAVPFRPRCT